MGMIYIYWQVEVSLKIISLATIEMIETAIPFGENVDAYIYKKMKKRITDIYIKPFFCRTKRTQTFCLPTSIVTKTIST